MHTLSLFLPRPAAHPDLHSFPTRRSSDLEELLAVAEAEALEARQRQEGIELRHRVSPAPVGTRDLRDAEALFLPDRKSTRLNSSHGYISYAVFCLKKKKHKNYYNIFGGED